MNILTALLLALVPALTQPASVVQEPPSAERIEAAVEALGAAFGPKAPKAAGPRIEALLEHGWIDDERVISKVQQGLYDRHALVRINAVEMLGGMTSKFSLRALTRYFERRHYKIRLEVELWPRLFRAIGRRRDTAAIPALLKDVRGQMKATTLRARFFALANIRSVEAIEGVLTVLDDLDEFHRARVLPDAHTALLVLTGQQLEGDAEALRSWWESAAATFVLPAEAPRLEGDAWEAWRVFWELPRRPEPGQDESSGDAQDESGDTDR